MRHTSVLEVSILISETFYTNLHSKLLQALMSQSDVHVHTDVATCCVPLYKDVRRNLVYVDVPTSQPCVR